MLMSAGGLIITVGVPLLAEVDLSIYDEDITLSDEAPIAGDPISIEAIVHGDQSTASNWEKLGVVLDIGGTGEDMHIYKPSVLQMQNGTYVMWYTGDADDGLAYRQRIFRAFSYDGIVWHKEGLALDFGGLYEEYGVSHPYVMVDDDGYYQMWYTGIGYSGGYRYHIHRAVSYDNGLTWEKLGREMTYGSSADPDGAAMSNVLFDGTEWHMWYTGVFWVPLEYKICHAHKNELSDPWIKDGVVINNDGVYDNPIAGHPWVLPTASGYEIYYSGYDDQQVYRLLHATSPDGFQWTKTGITLEPTLPLEGDMVGLACVLYEDNTYKAWYSGKDGSNWRIFYAEKTPAESGLDATCTVSFYLDSINPGNLIDQVDNVFVPADGETPVSIDWIPEAGNHTIIVEVSDVNPPDYNLSNNVASAQVFVESLEVDLSIYDEDIMLSDEAPVASDPISIEAVVHGDQSMESARQKYGVALDIGGEGEDKHVMAPSVMQMPNGTYVMWYVGKPQNAQNNYCGRIFRAFSFNGIDWQKQGLVMDYGGPYQEHGVTFPYVYVLANGTYTMWYTGTGYSGGYRYHIHRAISFDEGFTWQKLGREMTYGSSADPDGVCQPYVLFDGTQWRMWYDGIDWSPYRNRICHAHKAQLSDPWIKDGVVLNNDGPYDNPHAMRPWVLEMINGYEMFYTGQDNSLNGKILHATSPDGMNWTRTGVVIEPTLSEEGTRTKWCCAMLDDDTYKLWYYGNDGTNNRVFYAEKTPAESGLNATCTVSFYLDSITEENLIGHVENVFVPADSDTFVSIDWIPEAGNHTIIVEVSDVNPPDYNLSNNVASTQVYVEDCATVDLSIYDDDITFSDENPTEDVPVTIEAIVHGDEGTESIWEKYGVVLDIGGAGEDLHVCKPCVLQMPNGTYVMWYTGDGDDGLTYRHRIFRAFSYDGIEWFREGLVLDYGNSYEQYGVLCPYVIVDESGTYQMWYTGIGYSGGYRAYIHRATSSDGISWQKQGLELNYGTSADPDGVRAPCVLFNGTQWRMWYGGIDWGSPNQVRICHAHKATLSDPWIKDGIVLNNDGPYDYPSAAYPWVLPTDDGYEMFYTGYVPYTGPSRVLYATSPDGLSWTKIGIELEGSLPLETNSIGMASLLLEENTYKMWYSGYDGNHQRLFYAEKLPARQGQDATCTVSFYLDSIAEENLIDHVENVFVPADGETPVSIDWIPVAGNHTIIVEVSDVNPPDSNLSNNLASVQVYVEECSNVDLSIYDEDITLSDENPTDGVPMTIEAVVHGDKSVESSWVKDGVVLDIGETGEPDDARAYNPTVIFYEGLYRMWYSGYDGGASFTHRVLYATSLDGIQWTKYGVVIDVGGQYDQYRAYSGSVIVDGGIYKMWYGGYDGQYYRVLYATSNDGMNWVKEGIAVDVGGTYENLRVLGPTVLHDDDGTYKMWYSGYDGSHYRIMYATSEDGINWMKQGLVLDVGGNNSAENVHNPAVVRNDQGIYEMWYSGGDGSHNRILYAISNDGINWVKMGLTIDIGQSGESDDIDAQHPCVLLTNEEYKMWYSGNNGNNFRVLYATKAVTEGQDATCTVSFYLDSIAEENLIDRVENVFVPADGETPVSIDWIPEAGDHTIIVEVSDVNPPDSDLSNNVASKGISVQDSSTATATGPQGAHHDPIITITYNWTGMPTAVEIYYSTNAGDSWNYLGTDASVDGFYDWTPEANPGPKPSKYYWIANAQNGADDVGIPANGTPPEAGPFNWKTWDVCENAAQTFSENGDNWYFISIPLNINGDVITIFDDEKWGDGGTTWDYIQWYDASVPGGQWKSYSIYRPPALNDMPFVNNTMGIWIHLTSNDGDGVLTVGEGIEPVSTTIILHAGWNLVGYPSLNTKTVANALWGTGADKVEVFDPAGPYHIKEVGSTYVMKPGEGYWIHVPTDSIWTIDW